MIRRPGARAGAHPGACLEATLGKAAVWMLAAMLILIDVLAPPAVAAAPAPKVAALDPGGAIDLIDRCSERAVPEIDIGYERIAQRCPELVQGLQGSDLARWLPRDWARPANDLTVAGLKQLRAQLRAELDRNPARAAPPLAGLGAAIARFAPKSAAAGWWTRLSAWLRRALESPDTPAPPSGLPAWLHVPAWLVARLVVGGAVLVILVALGMLIRQLRTSGALRRRAARAPGAEPLPQPPRDFTLADIDRAPLLEQPSLLLRFAAPHLSAGGAALTARELRERLWLRTHGAPQARALPHARPSFDGAVLEPLIDLAETIRYAARPPADEAVRMTLAATRPAVASLGDAVSSLVTAVPGVGAAMPGLVA